MLSSKYAPVVALTVVAIIILGVLGWFLAIKPQIDETGTLSAQADEVRTNTELIETTSASLDNYQEMLDSLPDLTPALSLNAPTAWDMPAFRARLDAAVKGSGLEIASYTQGPETLIEGWPQQPGSLVSTQIATLFQTGPVNVGPGEEYVAPVTPVADAEATTEGISAVSLTMTLAGAPGEMVDFFAQISDPEDPLFQIYDVSHEARPETSSSIAGVSDANDGDVLVTVTGFVYMLNADPTIIDEATLEDASIGSGSPFEGIEDAPEQPGAN